MSDTFVSTIPVTLASTQAAIAVGVLPDRFTIPFNYELIGVTASLGVTPAGASAIFDVLVSKANGTQEVTLWPGESGNPTIPAGSLDTGLVVPTASGDVLSYQEGPIEDPQAGADWSVGYDPYQLSPSNFPNEYGNLTTPAAGTAGSPWAYPSGSNELQNVPYLGAAGDVLQGKVVQIGSTTAGSDLVLIAWITKR